MHRPTLFLAALSLSATMASGEGISLRLSCDYQTDPLGLDNRVPCFSWAMEGPLDQPISQDSYRVLVATSADRLTPAAADMWDSGTVSSSESAYVPYEGKALASRESYFWKVILTTNAGETLASAPARWEMGLLEPTDWHGDWISGPRVYSFRENAARFRRTDPDDCPDQTWPSPLLRTTFVLEKPIHKARLYIAGLGYHEAYLNGLRVGDHVLDPAWTAYHKRVLYVTHDVTELLGTGKNAWGVILGDGWYNQHSRDTWSTQEAPWRGRPKVLAQIEVEYTDGSRQVIVTSDTWKAHPSPITFSSVRQGESYDARMEIPGWAEPGFNDSEWKPVWLAMAPLGELQAQPLQPMRVKESFLPSKIEKTAQGTFVLHYPQDLAGWLKIRVREQPGTTIILKYGEVLNEDGTVNQDEIGKFTKHRRFQSDEYTCKSDQWEEWHPRFTYHGFTYVEVSGLSALPKPENFLAQAVYTDMNLHSSFACSDPVVNKIHEICLWSIKGNAHGYAEASPHREKLGWTGDAHLAAETTLYNFDSLQFYRKWIEDLGLDQRPSGELPAIAPTSGWGFFWGNGPAWDSAYILIPWYQYVFSGDRRIIEDHYHRMRLYFDYVVGRSPDNIARFGLGDWRAPHPEGHSEGLKKTPPEVTSTGYFYINARILANISRILGFRDQASKYERKAAEIKEAFNREFFDEESSVYATRSQTAQACAIYQGLTTEANHEAVVEKLVEMVRENGERLDTGILGSKYLLYALSDNGHEELAYTVITQPEHPGWGNFVARGATTIWEGWGYPGKEDPARNLAFLVEVSAWFQKTILGIKYLEDYPGFKHFELSPYFFEKLDWARGSVATVYGDIHVHWQREGKAVRLEVTVPHNTTAQLRVPGTHALKETGARGQTLPSGRHSVILTKVP